MSRLGFVTRPTIIATMFVLTATSGARADASASTEAPEAKSRMSPPPDDGYTWVEPPYYPSIAWTIAQLVPSPEVAVGRVRRFDDASSRWQDETRASFGLRWELTPLLWSWGINRHLSRMRWFVVDPLARNAGSIQLDTSFEYFWGDVNRVLVRPGLHATFPLLSRGEYLSMSMGTSMYQYDDTARVAYDVGIHVLYGVLGAQFSYAPGHAPLRTIGTLTIRYF